MNKYIELYNMYCIFSKLSILEIRLFLNCLKYDDENIELLKVIYDKNGNDTYRTLLQCSKSLYDRLIEYGFGEHNWNCSSLKCSESIYSLHPNNMGYYKRKSDFRIEPYRIHKSFS